MCRVSPTSVLFSPFWGNLFLFIYKKRKERKVCELKKKERERESILRFINNFSVQAFCAYACTAVPLAVLCGFTFSSIQFNSSHNHNWKKKEFRHRESNPRQACERRLCYQLHHIGISIFISFFFLSPISYLTHVRCFLLFLFHSLCCCCCCCCCYCCCCLSLLNVLLYSKIWHSQREIG